MIISPLFKESPLLKKCIKSIIHLTYKDYFWQSAFFSIWLLERNSSPLRSVKIELSSRQEKEADKTYWITMSEKTGWKMCRTYPTQVQRFPRIRSISDQGRENKSSSEFELYIPGNNPSHISMPRKRISSKY